MGNPGKLAPFDNVFLEFCDCIRSVPDRRFLEPMNGWSPREVVAHLIGWHYRMIQACQEIRRGQAPGYYADAANDYANLNAASVAQFMSCSKEELLKELITSRQEFLNYLGTLDPSEWDADHGVAHHRGGPATAGRIVEALLGDYRQHTKEIRNWLAGRPD